MSLLDYLNAVDFATKKHKGQKRYDGSHYISHPIAVADSVYGSEAKVVAVLHDTIAEDTDVTYSDIKKKFGQKIADTVDILSRRDDEDYRAFIYRIIYSHNKLAVEVKIADIEHNLSTLDNIDDPDKKAILKKRYKWALEELKS